MRKFFQRGFTLIELLVVIAIIAILAVTVITVYNNATKQAKDSQKEQMVTQINNALQMYLSQNEYNFGSSASSTATLLTLLNGILTATQTQLDGSIGSVSVTSGGSDYCIISKAYDSKTSTYFYAKNGATGKTTTNACP